jgi:fibronectin type 3 domain-containing protein
VGDPLPPALNIPQRITDLKAVEVGDRIEIEFTLPSLTTEGIVLRTLGGVDLRAGRAPAPGGAAFDPNAWADSAKVIETSSEQAGPVKKTLGAREWAGQEIIIGVRALNAKGRTSGWSNFVALTVREPLAKPVVTLASHQDGARISWTGNAPKFQVFRKAAGSEQDPVLLAEVEGGATSYIDKAAEFGARYAYAVLAWDGNVRSDRSDLVEISPVDTFPPARPTGIQAIPGVNTVELAWERATDTDLRGYRVYRSVEGGAFERLTELVDVPSFSDKSPASGKKCLYAVSSLDIRGNESQRSTPVEITAP